jgi:hydroxymethylpyrimidine pyrophosphatase-like HAD family hydrolase
LRFRVLAVDYDGTIAKGDVVHPDVRAALAEVRTQGVAVLVVTGRRLDDLRRVAGDLRFADAVVAEGGAVVLYPASDLSFALSPAPSRALLDELRRRQIPFTAGQSVVEAEASFASEILDIIRQRELPLVILFNRSRLMVLPQSISKATGLREALAVLRLSSHNALGIGDAENDHALLEACEVGVAVAWGSPTLKEVADEVLEGRGPAALAPYVRHAAARPRLPPVRNIRHRVVLGSENGQQVSLPIRGRNVLVTGDSGSGKSWMTGLLTEQLILARYSVCVVDPEGDYASLDNLPGVVVLGHDSPPSLREVERTLHYPDISVVVDLSVMAPDDRRGYVSSLLEMLASARRAQGFPHRIIVDEAHYFLDHPGAADLLDFELAAYMLTTYQMSRLDPRILAATEAIMVTRVSEPAETQALLALAGVADDEGGWRAALADLPVDEAVLVDLAGTGGPQMRRFRTARRLTPHVRHRHKYADVPIVASDAFVFTRDGVPVGPAPRTLGELAATLRTCPADVVHGHRRRHDFSSWIGDAFRDRSLAKQVLALESDRYQTAGDSPAFADAVARLIVERYRPAHGRSAGPDQERKP